MKKTAVALAVMALGVTSVHAAEIHNKDGNKLDLYGKVKAVHTWTDGTDADGTYARLGFRGETQINDQLTGYGHFESQFDAAGAEGSQDGIKTRLAFAGLDYGHDVSFDYGRNYGVAYDVGSYTDVLSEFGGDSYENTDCFLTTRTSGVATLRTKNLFGAVDGVNLAAQYQGQDDTDADPAKQHGNGYGFSLGYDNIADSGVSAIAAYSTSAVTAEQKQQGWEGDNAEFWGAGLKYDANAVYVATMYGESHNLIQNANKAQHFEAMAAYVFDFGLRPNVAYVHSRDTDNTDLTEYVALGTDYYFNKNIVADVGYKFNLLNGQDGDNEVVAGLTYQF
ncbi:porin [Citrobacter sp. wls613]|uniref:porin n=1 Tax=Citrobacter sp. wls613 TaxID=2576436 RepID=UPI0010CA6FB7|nr:porin [Citrobacter sp. wls613]TKV24865.1 phosphoporin PhoE [Citrobacter sp. wls613]